MLKASRAGLKGRLFTALEKLAPWYYFFSFISMSFPTIVVLC